VLCTWHRSGPQARSSLQAGCWLRVLVLPAAVRLLQLSWTASGRPVVGTSEKSCTTIQRLWQRHMTQRCVQLALQLQHACTSKHASLLAVMAHNLWAVVYIASLHARVAATAGQPIGLNPALCIPRNLIQHLLVVQRIAVIPRGMCCAGPLLAHLCICHAAATAASSTT
jgi:hypothetical protein